MFIEADELPTGSRLQADVCIVGAGAAGIALALDLAERNLSVLLLEGGYRQEDRRSQDLYRGQVADEKLHSPPDRYRVRQLGGSTLIWGGRCVPYDPIDFEARPYMPLSGWPITHDEVARFYPAANAILEAGQCRYDADELFGKGDRPMIAGFDSAIVHTNGLERFSCPTNFAARYERRLARASNIQVVTGANCIAVRLEPHGRQVRALEFATFSDRRFEAIGLAHVLAVGGIETARLLLASSDVSSHGVGNELDVVGRYYQCHIAANVGMLTIDPKRAVRHDYEIAPDGIYCRRRLAVAESEQRRLGLANMVARLHFPRITDPSHRNGVLSTLFLARNLISYEYGKRLSDGPKASLQSYLRHLCNVVADPLDTAAFFHRWITKRTLASRKFPSVILRNRTNRFSLEINAEQLAQAASRITLLDECDALGMPRVRIDWRYDRFDIESVRRTLDVLAAEFQRTGAGKLEYESAELEQELMRFGALGGHHIGTARMGTDVHTSVVDADNRVHSVDNLFIASSATFPSSSQANPSLTIVALALRLGEHLSGKLDAQGAL